MQAHKHTQIHVKELQQKNTMPGFKSPRNLLQILAFIWVKTTFTYIPSQRCFIV